MKEILLDPKFFNYVLIALYFVNACRWAVERKWADVACWICALGITATVTFGYKR